MREFIENHVGPIVYHGAKTPDLEVLEPRPHKLTSEPVVFAATLLDVAVAMAGGWTDEDLSFGREGQEVKGHFVRYTLEEQRPGALDEFFSDRTYVYLLPSDSFVQIDSLQDFELGSAEAVEAISFVEIENPLEYLENSGVVKIKRFKPLT